MPQEESRRGDYSYYSDGISRIRNHILNGKFSGEIAGGLACRVLYLAASMLTAQNECLKIEDASEYSVRKIDIAKPKRFNYLRFADPKAYGYMVESAKLLQGTKVVL